MGQKAEDYVLIILWDDFLAIKGSLLIIKGGGILSELLVQQRAGGIVFRNENNQIEFLLVTSNSNRNRWIIPAGHVEAGESYQETALREVAEEAGVEAAIFSTLGVDGVRLVRNS